MTKHARILLVLSLAAATLTCALFWRNSSSDDVAFRPDGTESSGKDMGTKKQQGIGSRLGNTVGTQAWIAWLRSLPPDKQSEVLTKIETTMYPDKASTDDWKAVSVAPGPGNAHGDVFPCKVLTNYKRLLCPREGLGIVGLQFVIDRSGDSILTSIWGANTKGAILVDWTRNRAIPISGMSNLSGMGLSPQYVPPGLLLMGGDGELGFSGTVCPWRKGLRAYPLALSQDEAVWFGTVYRDQPRELLSLVCVSPQPPKILGEIEMPPSKTVVWCLYDTKQKVLLVAEHEWNWITMIDFANRSLPAVGSVVAHPTVPGTEVPEKDKKGKDESVKGPPEVEKVRP